MSRHDLVIRPLNGAELDAFGAYLTDQLGDNGRNGTPLFHPQPRAEGGPGPEKLAAFRTGIDTVVGQPKWRRFWVALDASGAIAGHVDLRAHAEPCAAHRALLGMGAHRAHRGQGLGGQLLAFAIAWAIRETQLEWIDLDFLAGNSPAERLYRRAGFEEIATIKDRFRIDGLSVDEVVMTKRLRP